MVQIHSKALLIYEFFGLLDMAKEALRMKYVLKAILS